MLSVSMSHGFKRSLATAAGDLSANAIQMLLAGLGLAALVTNSQYGFSIVKWAGVSYLVWVGIRQIVTSFSRDVESPTISEVSLLRLWLRGFITSAANPKAVVFFAALFPQFLDPGHALLPQIGTLGLSYIVIDGCFLAAYGKGASWIAEKLHNQHKALLDRAAGASLIIAALLLGLRANERT